MLHPSNRGWVSIIYLRLLRPTYKLPRTVVEKYCLSLLLSHLLFRQPVREIPSPGGRQMDGKTFSNNLDSKYATCKKRKKKTIKGQEIISAAAVIRCVDSKSWNESYGHIASSNIAKKAFKKKVKLPLTVTQCFWVEAISKGSHLQHLPMCSSIFCHTFTILLSWDKNRNTNPGRGKKKKRPWKHRNSGINKTVLLPVTINKYYIWGTSVHQWWEGKAAAVFSPKARC